MLGISWYVYISNNQAPIVEDYSTDYYLKYHGAPLFDGDTAQKCNITRDSTIYQVLITIWLF